MRNDTLALLCCPTCKAKLYRKAPHQGEYLTDGDLLCSACDRSYPIRDGIVHFIDSQDLQGPNQRYERFYNRLAPFYSLFSKFALLPFGGERKARQEILNHLDTGGERLLEVSIGNGVNLPYLLEVSKDRHIYGIDISIGQLRQCRKLINKRGWQADLFLATAEALPFKAGIFDNVLHIGGINFFTGRQQSIDEMVRVVRPGGKVVIADEAERLAKRFNGSTDTSLKFPLRNAAELRTSAPVTAPNPPRPLTLISVIILILHLVPIKKTNG